MNILPWEWNVIITIQYDECIKFVQACEDAWRIYRRTHICVFVLLRMRVWFFPAFLFSHYYSFLLVTHLVVVVVTRLCCGTRRQHLVFSCSHRVCELSSSFTFNFLRRVHWTLFTLCESFTLCLLTVVCAVCEICCSISIIFHWVTVHFHFLSTAWIFITIYHKQFWSGRVLPGPSSLNKRAVGL